MGFIVVKWQSAYDVHKYKRTYRVTAGALVQYYDATNAERTPKYQPFLPSKNSPISEYINGVGTNKNLVICHDGARNRNDSAGEDLQLFI
jgi:hypothetical protein